MLVKDCMTRHPIMISPETPASEAQKLMSENRIRHLPVVGDGKRLLGLVTHERLSLKPELVGSLGVWEITRYLANLKVKDVMIKADDVVTIEANRTVERAARTMADKKLSGLVALEEGIVIGVITETDVMNSFQEMLGLPKKGVRITMRMPNRKGEFHKVINVLVRQQWGVMGIGTFPTPKDPNSYDVVIKIPEVSTDDVRQAFSQIEGQQIVDIRDIV